jgi:hypothetical protein
VARPAQSVRPSYPSAPAGLGRDAAVRQRTSATSAASRGYGGGQGRYPGGPHQPGPYHGPPQRMPA